MRNAHRGRHSQPQRTNTITLNDRMQATHQPLFHQSACWARHSRDSYTAGVCFQPCCLVKSNNPRAPAKTACSHAGFDDGQHPICQYASQDVARCNLDVPPPLADPQPETPRANPLPSGVAWGRRPITAVAHPLNRTLERAALSRASGKLHADQRCRR